MKEELTAALVCAAVLLGIDFVFFDGRDAAATMLVLSDVYQRWW